MGRCVVGVPEDVAASMTPYQYMHPDDVAMTAHLHPQMLEKLCPIVVTHRMFNYAINRCLVSFSLSLSLTCAKESL